MAPNNFLLLLGSERVSAADLAVLINLGCSVESFSAALATPLLSPFFAASNKSANNYNKLA